jgi:hypothetical protein
MRYVVIALFLAFTAAAAHADSADLVLELNTDRVLRAGDWLNVIPFLHNAGPDVAHNVVLTLQVS